ncbi:zinc finger protein 208-like isoform X1 [Anastrepha ludens]|uniref:zinc finger protein 208-like isoform X1 n=1 Tax=Anastrepha ludens TaxID=28586 RepID=UPI0023AEB239|nr:zinc finger protein 208-like isoform X1 [Anastrepha ludens]
MEESPGTMTQETTRPSTPSTDVDPTELAVNVKQEVELMVDEYETNSNIEDEDYDGSDSESGYHFDYEPEVKRPCPVLPDLDAKKNAYIKSASYIYSKFVMRQCPMCDYEFNSAHCWKKHLNFVHHLEKPEDLQFKYNEVGAKCKLCDFQTATPDFNKLLDHQISHMPFSHYLKCKLCEWRTKTHPSMNFHLRQQHSDILDVTCKSLELTVCPYCQQEFASQWYVRKHIIQEHAKTIDDRTCFICLECGEEFLTNASLRAHVAEKFKDKSVIELGFKEFPANGDDEAMFKCIQCPTVFRKITSNRTIINLREHYMLHLGEPTGKHAYKCRYCEESFRRFDNMRVHVCDELRKVLETMAGSKNMSFGTNKAPSLSRKRKMAKKMQYEPVIGLKRDYMKYIRHVCLKCGVSFGKLFHCKRHMFQKHGMNKPEGLDFRKVGNQSASDVYECTVCEEFTSDFDLNTMLVHARIHTVFDPLQCKHCHQSFGYESEIPGHECVDVESVNTLTEKRGPREIPIPNMESFCPKCGQTYSTPSCLTRHMNRVHGMNEPYGLGFEICEPIDVTEKVYRCSECENFTAMEKNLKAMLEHAREHFPFDSFRCTLCKERFRLKDQARRHQCSNDTSKEDDMYDEKILKKARLNKMGRFCPKCGKTFTKTCICKTHITQVHGFDKPAGLGFEKIESMDGTTEETYRCIECITYTTTLDLGVMLEHAREHFPFESFWCMLCNERFRLKVHAKEHKCLNATSKAEYEKDGENDKTSRARYPKTFEKCIRKFCPECNTEMPSVKTWRWHLCRYHEMGTLSGLHMKQTKGNLVECLICQVQMTYARRQEHRFVHLPFKPFQCKYCSEYFIEIEKAKFHCSECTQIPLNFEESEEPKVIVRDLYKRFPRRVEIKIDDKNEQMNGLQTNVSDERKAQTMKCHKQTSNNMSLEKLNEQEELDSGNESRATNKGICVVLTDDNDFAKFVRISCPLCPDTEFESNLFLSRHFNEVHDNFREHFTVHKTNSANCKTCNKYFNIVYKKTMIKHYLSEINATCFWCRLCEKNMLYFETMRTHLLEDHQAVIAGQTQEASSSTSTTADVTDPLKVTSVDISKVSRTTMAIPTSKTAVFNEFNAYISYACPECNVPFDTSEQWHLHINGEHDFFDQHQLNIEATPDGFKRCKQCSVNISGGVLAEQRHKLTHMQFKSFICTLCQHRSTTLGVLTQHFRRRHFAKGAFKCGLCPRVLSTSCEQIEHIKSEHDPREYPPRLCRVCFNIFSSARALLMHMDLHNPNREVFQCNFCDRLYKYKRELRLHVRAKHPGKEVTISENN